MECRIKDPVEHSQRLQFICPGYNPATERERFGYCEFQDCFRIMNFGIVVRFFAESLRPSLSDFIGTYGLCKDNFRNSYDKIAPMIFAADDFYGDSGLVSGLNLSGDDIYDRPEFSLCENIASRNMGEAIGGWLRLCACYGYLVQIPPPL
ncbi:unnamed protein product [Colias eurytheme]|nr:unnamed protein product [Colias eurytheme]